ncbi:MAG TPA: phosphatidate cytidylyltransferase [Gemmatimonadaceae bacterium]|nr:phosphatidate cytidylyltransferase [Gemmatimonadaceae bacterium]
MIGIAFFSTMLGRLVSGVIALLVVATIVGFILSRTTKGEGGRKTVANLNARIRAWWIMVAVFAVAIGTGGVGSIVLFFLMSFLAMREFMTLTPTARTDHAALFWAFFIFAPIQYLLVWAGWYGLFSVLIPVYGFVAITSRMALSGDTERFLERTSTVQWGMMACVYCVSHAPALLMLGPIPGYSGNGATLLFYLVLVAQLNDVMQYVWGKLAGKRPVAPTVSPNKTWGGFIGGTLTAIAVGTALYWATPFTPIVAAAMSLAITLLGFMGGLVMSAIKRDRGVKDYGTLIQGHGGVLDRIDSLLFAAPVFFHLIRFFYVP